MLIVNYQKSFWAVPAPEAFSRHSGTCKMLGDSYYPPTPHHIQVGDVLRVGSVGIVVTETHTGCPDKNIEGQHMSLSDETIDVLVRDTHAVVSNVEEESRSSATASTLGVGSERDISYASEHTEVSFLLHSLLCAQYFPIVPPTPR